MRTTTFLLFCLLASSLFSQSNIQEPLSVNTSGAAADASAQLDVSATVVIAAGKGKAGQ